MQDTMNAAARTPAPAASSAVQWERVATALRAEIGDNNFRSWFLYAAPLSLAGGVFTLGVPTRFVRDWVRTHYADRLRALWAQHCGAAVRIEVTVDGSGRAPAPAALPEAPANDAGPGVVSAPDFSTPLDARFTFDSYVAAEENALASAAARKAAAGMTQGLNPLYIHGDVGQGKTHLLQSMAADVRVRRPAARVVYMSAEAFMYRFVQALRQKDTMAFKAFFRETDVLLIDDVQFICGKESTQEEFLHTVNTLLDQGRQIVLSADRAPGDLEGVGERLRSRLGGGLVAQVSPAGRDLRFQILRAKCGQMGRAVPDDVLAFLAGAISSSARALEGALNRLIAHAELTHRAMTVETAQEALQDLLRAADRRVTAEEIQQKTAAYYGLRVSDLHSPRRARPVARPRQVAMYLCKALTGLSLPDIGRRFGGRDHTTIMHGIRRIEALMAGDAQLAGDVAALKRMLAG